MTTANITPINIEDEIRHSYMDYAMSVIIGRALPDVRDGLKPVHRRILYAMHELGNRWNQSYKKSARVVGDVIGKYHPHGDSAVYDALVRMAQDFNMSLPLVDGQGNFGSVDGDPPAAMRYTEVRMARSASDLLSDIDKETVAWGPNYDDSLKEPIVLPTRIPNLLVNGSEGIAVGMSTKIPPHNLSEIIDGTIALIQEPTLEVVDLMAHIKGPDFPTHGFICGRRGILDAYKTGRGSITMRARAEIEEIRKGRMAVVVTELPFQVNKARLIEKIAMLVRDKRLTDIADLRDESDRKGMRIVIELKNTAVPDVVLNQLYKMTAMQQNFGVIMLAIVAGQPRIMDLKEVLLHFIDFRRDVVRRRTLYELRKAQEREHILEGLVKALDHIDAVIEIIRGSRTALEAREGLMGTFELSEIQAQAILDMRLQRLTGLERDKIQAELDAIRVQIGEYKEILTKESRLLEVIIEELQAVKELHGVARRTQLVEDTGEIDILELIAEEDVVITVSHTGYVKRTPLSDYREQNRGGKGRRGMSTKDEDFVTDVFVASTHDTFLVFTTFGRVLTLGVHEIPPAGPTGRGKAVVNLLPAIAVEEKVAAIVPIRSFDEDRFLIFATRKGLVKRTALSEYRNVHAGGIRAIRLTEGDDLIEVRLVENGQDVLLATANGQSIRFTIDERVRAMGRNTQGVKGITLIGDDRVIGMAVLDVDQEGTLLTVCAFGYGKRTPFEEYPSQNRGGKGVITIKTSERNGQVVAVRSVTEVDSLILISNTGQIIRTSVNSISTLGRNTQGVKLFTVAKGESIVSMALAMDEEEDELAEGQEADGEQAEGADASGAEPQAQEDGQAPAEAEGQEGDADQADAADADAADADADADADA